MEQLRGKYEANLRNNWNQRRRAPSKIAEHKFVNMKKNNEPRRE